MPGVYTLESRDGREENLYGHRGYHYVFDDGTMLSFLPEPAWCRHCQQIRLCEHLHEPATIQQMLSELEDPGSKKSLELARSSDPLFAARWKQTLEAELRHATLRKLPPSCLHCGHRDVAYFLLGQWAPHPGTGEEVRFSISGMCSTDFAVKFYDIDGTPLQITEEERAAMWKIATQRLPAPP